MGSILGAVVANAAVIFIWLVYIALIVLVFASWWKIFEKAGKPGWAAIVPIYNIIVLLLIPCLGIVFYIIIMIDFAKSFGKDAAYAVGLILLGVVFLPMLAFGQARYVGPSVRA